MASITIAIGYHGMAGKEFIKPEFSYPIADGDVIHFAKTVEEVVDIYENNPAILESKAEKAANYIHTNHSLAKEEEDIVNTWKQIFGCPQYDSVINLNTNRIIIYSTLV